MCPRATAEHPGPSASVRSVPCRHIRAQVPGVSLHGHPPAPAVGLMTHVSGNRISMSPACLYLASGQPQLLPGSPPCLPGCHQPPAWALRGHQHMAGSHRVPEKFLGDKCPPQVSSEAPDQSPASGVHTATELLCDPGQVLPLSGPLFPACTADGARTLLNSSIQVLLRTYHVPGFLLSPGE